MKPATFIKDKIIIILTPNRKGVNVTEQSTNGRVLGTSYTTTELGEKMIKTMCAKNSGWAIL
jgi:hypothetical protein